MPSSDMTCCFCQTTFSAPTGKSGRSFKCPHCGQRLARAPEKRSPGPKGRSAAIRLALVVVAVPALAVAGIKIYSTLAEEFKKPQPASGPDARSGAGSVTESGANDAGSVAARSRVSIYQSGDGNGARATVALGMPVAALESGRSRNDRAGILQRELIRQAFLMAARDELGLGTRDEVLGERPTAKAPASSGPDILTISGRDGLIRLVVRPAEGAGTEPLLDCDLTKPAEATGNASSGDQTPEDLANLSERTEELSRSDLPAILRKLGLDGKPNVLKALGAVPESIENRLAGLGFTEVFAGVKDLHALIRSDGESPARLGALVRGYALLGVLSEFQWHPAHKGFKARSLLYAQRLVARGSKNQWGLWHRAFAEALVGLHKDAIADLAAAETAPAAPGKAVRPSWVALISALARCDAKGLEAKGGPHAKLQSLLRMTLLEFPASPNVTLPAASDVIRLEPDCYRAIDAMCAIQAVSTLHVVTMLGPQTLEESLPKKLKAIESLPLSVQAFLKKPEGGSLELVRLLEAAAGPEQDGGELSWSALGHLIRETQFVHVYRRLSFMKFMWAVPVDDFWGEARGWVAGHPLEPFLVWFVSPPAPGGPAIDAVNEQIKSLNMENLEPAAAELFRRNNNVLGARTNTFTAATDNHSDHVVRDISLRMRNDSQRRVIPDPVSPARLLLAVSPHSHYARGNLIEFDWERAKSHLPEWQKEAGGSPTLLGAIARRYQAMGRNDDAERLLAEYIKLSPDYWASEMLAGIFKKKGNEARWLEVLEQFLEEGGDPGLDQAQVRVELANHYMSKKQWDKARPYADAAAATGAGWAMICAQTCAEGRKDWAQAEQWARATSERYPDISWDRWYTACIRTGVGDVEAARAFTNQWVSANAQGASPDVADRIASFYLASGQPAKALPIFHQSYASSPSMPTCAIAWLTADLADDGTARDEYFTAMENRHKTNFPRIAATWRVLHQAVDRDGGKSLDLEALANALAGAPPNNVWLPQFVIGMFLEKRGRPVEARQFLTKSADNPSNNGWALAIARNTIRKIDQSAKNAKPAAAAKP
jgi:tetratricopeptide (TPR) repeat protein